MARQITLPGPAISVAYGNGFFVAVGPDNAYFNTSANLGSGVGGRWVRYTEGIGFLSRLVT
jgi:hypothetical protein